MEQVTYSLAYTISFVNGHGLDEINPTIEHLGS